MEQYSFKTKGARSKQQKLSYIPTHKTYHAAKEKVIAAILHLKLPPQKRNIKTKISQLLLFLREGNGLF